MVNFFLAFDIIQSFCKESLKIRFFFSLKSKTFLRIWLHDDHFGLISSGTGWALPIHRFRSSFNSRKFPWRLNIRPLHRLISFFAVQLHTSCSFFATIYFKPLSLWSFLRHRSFNSLGKNLSYQNLVQHTCHANVWLPKRAVRSSQASPSQSPGQALLPTHFQSDVSRSSQVLSCLLHKSLSWHSDLKLAPSSWILIIL